MKNNYKLANMSKTQSSGLTVLEEGAAERLAHLERDRWPEFERELRLRRNRKPRFILSVWEGERPRWAWLVWSCRKWDEVERVLNRNKVRWERKGNQIEMDGMNIYRCA